MLTCGYCGSPMPHIGPCSNPYCVLGGSYGTGQSLAPSYGNPYPPSGYGTGTNPAASASAQQIANAHLNALQSNAAYALMGAVGLQAGGFMQPHPLAGAFPYEPPKPLDHAGISVGEFVGWRIWGLSKDGFLTSYSAQYAWMPGHPARGEITDHGSGGIWSFKDPNKALHKATSEGGKYVVGSVWLWGEIIEHSDGYRAEYAMVRSIDVAPHTRCRFWQKSSRILDALRARYGVTGAAEVHN